VRWIPIPPDWTELIATSFDDPRAPAEPEAGVQWTAVDLVDGQLWMVGGANIGGFLSISAWNDASETFSATWWLPWRQIRAAVPSIEVLRRTGRVDVGETNRIVFGGSGRFASDATSQPHPEWHAELHLLRVSPWIELVSFEVDELAGLHVQIAAAAEVQRGELWLVGDVHGIRLVLGNPDDPHPVFQFWAQRPLSWRGQILLPRALLCAPRVAAGRRWHLYNSGMCLVAAVPLGAGVLWFLPIHCPVEIQPGLLEVKHHMVDLAFHRASSEPTQPPRVSPAVALFADLLAALPSRADGGQVLVSCRPDLTVLVASVGDVQGPHLAARTHHDSSDEREPVTETRRLKASEPLAAAHELGSFIETLLGHPLAADDVLQLGWVWPDDPTRLSDLMHLGPPLRVTRESTRFLRDRAPVEAIKELYQGQCQVCGYRITRPDGFWYAEAHHLWPLEHDGPDVMDNLVVVCPTHHKELDLGALLVDPRTGRLRAAIGAEHPHHGHPLRFVDGHTVDPLCLERAERCVGALGRG